ncbi:unnamed protein product [Meganyctiphanes norvegica]|uniref:glycogenin glucosyltransferase n=1 Tax=Meganyctiphanes norvegica TaxID=48144 RepID=A0AAV2QIK7_MEGNR
MEIRRFRQKFLLPDTAAANDSIAALSSDGVLAIITPKKDGTTPSIKRKLPEDVETPEKSSKYMTKHDPRSNETEKSTIIDREMVECFLPILQRGNFFTDSIFQETRQDFNTAITEVLDKWGDRSVHDPQRGTQREEPNEDNQVMVITDDENNTRKILVDIADFTDDGEVKINVMDEELVVEGRSKKAEGGATSVKTFIRRFTLAPDIDPSAVTSVVTPDRILEITTPKKAVIPKLKEFSIQVIIELIVEESRTSPRKDSKTRKKLKDKSPAKDTSSSHSKKKKKIPETGESEEYNKQAAAASYDDDLLKTENVIKGEQYKLHDKKKIGKSAEVSKLMAKNILITGEDIQTGASLEGIEESLGDKSTVAGEKYDQQIIASRDDNSDESDESQQTTESTESETVIITDIKRYILEATREYGSDDEDQQSKVSEDTNKRTAQKSEAESLQITADMDKINVQPKAQTVTELEYTVSFDQEEDLDRVLDHPNKKSVISQEGPLKDENQDKKEVITLTLTEETLSYLPSEAFPMKHEASFDISQSFDSVVDAPSKPDISEIEEEISANATVNGSLEDNQLIPIILNGNAQDNYEVGGDFKKILSFLPEHLKQESQYVSNENENVKPSTYENDSKYSEIEKDSLIINVEDRPSNGQKVIGGEYHTKIKDSIQGGSVAKTISETKQVMLPEAFVTLATNDDYAIGALVLGHSLHSVGTMRKLVIMITKDVSWDIRPMLHEVFNEVIEVNVMDSSDSAHLALLKRPELGVTFTKLHCWTLLQYSKCVFLDADMLAVQNPDDLFGYPELSAAPDIGWPDCFNSGMFVFVPNMWTYNRLLQHADTTGSFDGGDQGVLNTFFPKWNCISFIFNMVASAVYSYLPAYIKYGSMAKIIHFIGSFKPWHHTFNKKAGEVETAHGYNHIRGFLNSWWNIYTCLVEPAILKIIMARQPRIERSPGFGYMQGFSRWESGKPDYLGQDSYVNIQAHIDNRISQHELSENKKSTKKKRIVSIPSENKDNDSQETESPESFSLKALKAKDVSEEKLSLSSKPSRDLFKTDSEVEKQVQEIIEVPQIIKASEKKEALKQPPNNEKEDEDSDWVVVKSRRRRQPERKSESFEQQLPDYTDENEKQSLVSESSTLSHPSPESENKEESLTTEKSKNLTSKSSLESETIENIARFEKGAASKSSFKSKKSKSSQKSSKKHDPLDTTSTISKADSTLTCEEKQDFGYQEGKSDLKKYRVDEPSVKIKKSIVKPSKYPTVESEETKYSPEKRTKESSYSSVFIGKDLNVDQIETKTPKSTTSLKSNESFDISSTANSSAIQDLEQMSVRSKINTVKKSSTEDKNLIKTSQTPSKKSEEENVFGIDESKIWDMAALRYLGPKEQTFTQDDNTIQSIISADPQTTDGHLIAKPQVTQESFMPKSSVLMKGIRESSSSIKAEESLKSGKRDEDKSTYSKYSIPSSKKVTSHQKEMSYSVDSQINKSSETLENKKDIEPYISRKPEDLSDTSSSSVWESSLSALDRKLDYASNIFNTSSSDKNTEIALSDSGDKKLAAGSQVDETAKLYEQDILSPIDKRKIEVHPEDAKTQDKNQQDAKLQMDNTQELMTKSCEPEALAASSMDMSEDNRNKLSSDDAKSLEAQAVSKKKSKASEKEGLKDKLAAASECATEVSEASVDKTTKDSEGVKPSAKSQPDIQQNDKETKSQASSQKSKKKQTAQDEDSKLLSSEAEMDALTKSKSTTKQQEIATADGSAAFDQKSPKGKKELDTAGIPVAGEQKSTTEQQDHATADGSVVLDQKSPRNQQELDTAGIPITGEQKSNTEKQNLATADSSVDKTTKDSEGVKPSAKSQSDIQQNDKETKKASSQKSKKKQTAQDEASKLLSSETEMDALSKSKSTTKQQELATADGSAAFDQKSPKDQKELDTTGIPVTGEQKSTIEQQQLVTADSSAAFDKKSTEDQKELNTAGSPAAGEQNQKSPKDQKELDTAGIPVTGEQQSTTEQQQLATADSSVAFDQKSPKDQKELSTAGSPADGKQNQKSSKDQKELDTTGIPVTGEQKATTEQLQLATADSSVALDKTSSKGKKELNTTGSPAAGEQKSTTEQPDLSTVDGSIALDQKSPTKPQELDTAGIPTTGEQKSNIEQQNLATAESSVVLDQKSAKDKKELDTAGIPVTGEQKSTTEQQQLATAKSSVDFDQKSPKDQKDLDTTGSPVTGEQKPTTAQHELETAKISQSIEDQLKSTSTANISQPKSKQSASEDGVKTELLSSQQVEKEVKSTVQKSAKEDTTKVASDESVKPKKSTVKKDVSEKQDTESHKNTSTSKLDIQSSTSSRRKEEEKSISTKDAKALFQSQAASATGSTSDLRSTGSGSGSGLSGARFKSTSYSQLPGSSSPSSGYLATGTKTISTGSFTFKATEEYIKKKPPPRNRPFFNLRDFL